MKLDANRARVLNEVVRQGNYSLAARTLHVTPSAVSHSIRKLEEELGTELVRIEGRRAVLTDAGTQFAKACERAFSLLEHAENRILRGDITQILTVGCTVEFGTMILLHQLRPFWVERTDLRLHLYFSNQLQEPLLSGLLDLAIDCKPHLHPSVVSTDLFSEAYVVVAAPDFMKRHPLGDPVDLSGVPVLSMDPEAHWWDNFQLALPPANRPVLSHVLFINHVRGIIGAACEGMGVALVPHYAVLSELADGSLVHLFPELPIMEDRFSVYQLVQNSHREKNQSMLTFLRTLGLSEFGLDAITDSHP